MKDKTYFVAAAVVVIIIIITLFLQASLRPKSLLMPRVLMIDRPLPNDVTLPSPADIQRLLNRLEPENPLKVDGRIGRLTLEKWDRIYIRESARKASEGFYK